MALTGWGRESSPFHGGEQAVQARLGVRARTERAGRNMVRDFMPPEHREFFEDLPLVLVGSADTQGALWASLLIGEPGFIRSPGERSLIVRAQPFIGDPLNQQLVVGAPLGLLGIELSTRRRNRANGHVVARDPFGFELAVEQSFGNCRQYIQSRAGALVRPGPPAAEGSVLSPAALELLAHSDTSFIASSSREPGRGFSEGLDVSHRGGLPGFIRSELVGGATRVTLPDFSGNFMFNTFGNLEVCPRAGFLALDFESGGLLTLTGTARVIWDGPEVAAFDGAERLLEFRVERGWLWSGVFQGWSPPQISPHLRGTGVWPR